MVLEALLAILGFIIAGYLLALIDCGHAEDTASARNLCAPTLYRAHTLPPRNGINRRLKKRESGRIKTDLDKLLVLYRSGAISEYEYLKQADVLIDQLATTMF